MGIITPAYATLFPFNINIGCGDTAAKFAVQTHAEDRISVLVTVGLPDNITSCHWYVNNYNWNETKILIEQSSTNAKCEKTGITTPIAKAGVWFHCTNLHTDQPFTVKVTGFYQSAFWHAFSFNTEHKVQMIAPHHLP